MSTIYVTKDVDPADFVYLTWQILLAMEQSMNLKERYYLDATVVSNH